MAKKLNYRQIARSHHEIAVKHLAGDDSQIIYAALELRFALEALTYERMCLFESELPPEIDTWQPQKIMALLLSIDPNSDQNCTLRFAAEDETGHPKESFKMLGSERRISLVEIKKHYHALGSFLHIATPRTLSSKEHNPAPLRAKCELVEKIVNEALKSTLWNVKMGEKLKATCRRCHNEMPRMVGFGSETEFDHSCFHCKAPHHFRFHDGTWTYKPVITLTDCSNPNCDHHLSVWADYIKPDGKIVCNKCGTVHEFAIGIRVAQSPDA